MATASQRIAEWAVDFDMASFTQEQLHYARRALLDTVAVAIAGSKQDASIKALAYGRQASGLQRCNVWATPDRLNEEMAALVNGTMSHVLDFDDVSSPSRGHPSVVLWPAITAIAEMEKVSCNEAYAAFIIGLEIVAKLGRLMAIDHVAKGWHSTPTLGALGACVACGVLVKLTREQMVNAIGIAFAQASGTRENFGTMTKSLQAGIGAAAAVRAVRLAQRGFDASASALDGPAGFAAVYGMHESFNCLCEELGQPLEIERSGLDLKRYPLCYATHRAIDATLKLRKQYSLSLSDIESVEVLASAKALLALVHDRPRTSLEAKFSMPFAIATALLDGEVTLSSFDESNVLRDQIQHFLPYVSAQHADGAVLPRWTEVTLRVKSGAIVKERVQNLSGSHNHPVSDAEIIDKTRDCCAWVQHPECGETLAKRYLAAGQEPLWQLLGTIK